MQAPHRFNLPLALYAGVLAFFFAAAAQAQVRIGPVTQGQVRIGAAAPTAGPSAAAARTNAAAPNPAGLQSTFPAGLTSGSGAAGSSDPIAAANAPSVPTGPAPVDFNTTLDNAIVDSGTVVDTSRMGAAPAGRPAPSVLLGSAVLNPVEVARSFLGADANADGELSRSEATRLRIAPQSFEAMDRNFDGVVSRGEYEDSLR